MRPDPAADPAERQLRRACDELDGRLRAGSPARAEEWLAALPALAAAPDQAVELIFAEYLGREAAGPPPDPTEYYGRFPQYRDRLERLFGVDDLFKSAAPSTNILPDTRGVVPSPAAPPAAAIGRYPVLGKLGEGGMGVVYLARDLELNRPVAVKRLRGGPAADPAAVARFRQEAELIARLRHPNIAAVYEVGEADGCPHLVLEYADCGNLRAALAGRPQPPAVAARVAAAVARAADHAHRAGVIHRDIKPANVLLAADAGDPDRPPPLADRTPKLCDFGLAADAGGAAGLTRTGQVLGTPAYMAPEQAGGRGTVGPRTDVYAVGAVLYEALTGRPPFLAASDLDTLDLVREADPVPPRRLEPGVPRPLEAVCLKCLEKDPARRYATAAALADDLDRFLAGEPVRARPVGRLVRAARWCRRRPTTAAVAAVVLVAAAAGVGLAGWYTVRLDRARDAAVQEGRKATAAAERAASARTAARRALDLTTSAVIDDWLRRQPTMTARNREFLARVQADYEAFAADAADDPAARSDAADAFRRVGEVQLLLGRRDDAGRSLAEAERRFAELLAADPGDETLRSRRAAAVERLGAVREGEGDRPGAAAQFDAARRELEALAADAADRPAYRVRLAGVLVHLGRVRHDLGERAAADGHFRAAKAHYAELIERLPDDPAVRAGAGRARAGWADALLSKDDFKAALDEARAALAAAQPLADADPADPAAAFEVACCQRRVASILRALRRSREAEAPLQAAAQVLDRLVAVYPSVAEYRLMYATTLNTAGNIAADRDVSAAVGRYKAAADQLLRLLADDPGSAAAAGTLGGVYCNHGNAVLKGDKAREKDPAAALGWYAKAEGRLAGVVAAHPDRREYRQFLTNTVTGRADALTALDRHAEAADEWRRAIALDTGPTVSGHKYQLARALARAGRPADAVVVLDEQMREKEMSGWRAYWTAVGYSAAAGAAGPDAAAFDGYAAKAVAALERAKAAGAFARADLRKAIDVSKEFLPVRHLPAFRAFAAGLPPAPADPRR